MRLYNEVVIKIGLIKNPHKILTVVEKTILRMHKEGWNVSDTCIEDTLECMHLFFEKEISPNDKGNG